MINKNTHREGGAGSTLVLANQLCCTGQRRSLCPASSPPIGICRKYEEISVRIE